MRKQADAPTVSVLMGVQNVERFVGQAIESVLAQTFSDWEFIIVDDGSSDTTPDILREYAAKDNRIRPFFFKEKKGISYGCNFTIEKARGQYLARLDGDDYWAADKLQKQVDYMEKHPDIGACFTWVTIVNDTNQLLTDEQCEGRLKAYNVANRSQSEWLYLFVSDGCHVAHSSSFIRREVFAVVGGYNCAFRQLLDLELWVRICKQYPIAILEDCLTTVRWCPHTGHNMSAYNNGVHFRSATELFLLYSHLHHNLSDELFQKAFQQDFCHSNAVSHDEISCERALYLINCAHMYNMRESAVLVGLKLLADLLNQSSTRDVLEEKYHIDTFRYAEMTTNPFFYSEANISIPEEISRRISEMEDTVNSYEKRIQKLWNQKEHLQEISEKTIQTAYSEQNKLLAENAKLSAEVEEYHRTKAYRKQLKHKGKAKNDKH